MRVLDYKLTELRAKAKKVSAREAIMMLYQLLGEPIETDDERAMKPFFAGMLSGSAQKAFEDETRRGDVTQADMDKVWKDIGSKYYE